MKLFVLIFKRCHQTKLKLSCRLSLVFLKNEELKSFLNLSKHMISTILLLGKVSFFSLLLISNTGIDLNTMPMTQVYKKFGLEPGTQDFIGHAMALHLDDSYMNKPGRDTYERIVLYVASMARYGKSPYIYPLYGLGELPQGFARYAILFRVW